MKTLLADSQYFGNYSYFSSIVSAKHIVIEQYEPHQKGSFLNRCVVAGANGPVRLTVPLEKGRDQRTPVKEIRISNQEKWQQIQWKTLLSCYNGSPWFMYYHDEMAVAFKKKFFFLLDWNMFWLDWMLQKLGVSARVELTGEYRETYAPEDYLDIRKSTRERTGQPEVLPLFRYQQVFEEKTGFLPGMSVLDLLCCEGAKRTLALLEV